MAVIPPDPVFCLKADMGHIHSIAFVDNEQHNYTETLIAATENGTVYFWDLESLRIKYTQIMGESIQAIHVFKDKIITQEKAGMIKLWQMNNNQYEAVTQRECASGFCKSLLHNDQLIIPQEKFTIDVIAVDDDFHVTKTFKADLDNYGQIMCMQRLHINGTCYLLAGFESGDVLMWNYSNETILSRIKLRECITSLTFDDVKQWGVCGNASKILQVFHIDKDLAIQLKYEVAMTNEGCNIVKLRNDRKIFVAGGWDGRLRIYSWKSLRLLVALSEHKKGITDIQYSNHGIKRDEDNDNKNERIFAAASGDGVISLWSLYN